MCCIIVWVCSRLRLLCIALMFPPVIPCIFNNGRSHVKINYVLQMIYYYSLYYLCLFAYNGIQRILCCVFVLFFQSCVLYVAMLLWIFHCWLPVWFALTFIFVLCLVWLLFPVTLGFPYLVAPLVFSSGFIRYLCLLTYSGVQHILCCVFALVVFVLCTLCCKCLWIAHFWLPFGIL